MGNRDARGREKKKPKKEKDKVLPSVKSRYDYTKAPVKPVTPAEPTPQP
jgi:hypothetical protein